MDKEKNELIVGTENEIYKDILYAADVNYTLNYKIEDNVEITAKIRYSSKEAKATLIKIDNNNVKVQFKEPQRAITKGQSVVFYIDDVVLGGGKII